MLKHIIFIALITCSPFLRAEVIQIGFVEYPPHVINRNGVPTGSLVDYAREAAKKSGNQLQAELLPYKRSLIEVSANNIDFLMPIINPKDLPLRHLQLLFTEVPGLCFLKTNYIPMLSAKRKLFNLNIGYMDGLAHLDTLTRSGADLISIPGSNFIGRSMKMLRAGRLDAFYHPNPSETYSVKNDSPLIIACSQFHGIENRVFVARSSKIYRNPVKSFENMFASLQGVFPYIEYAALVAGRKCNSDSENTTKFIEYKNSLLSLD
mgnify:CR=1 FL=1